MQYNTLNRFASKNIFPFDDNYTKEIQQFADKLQKEIKRAEKCSKKNISNLKKEMSHEKVFNWLFKLKEQDRKKSCTLSSNYLRKKFLQFYQLYKKNNKISFTPSMEMMIFFQENEEDKIGNYEENNSYNSLNLSNNNGFLSNDVAYYNNKKDYSDIYESKNGEEKLFYIKKFSNSIQSNDEQNEAKVINQMEIEFLNSINFVSFDRSTITLSDELLSDFEKFKKFFKYFSINNCFKDYLIPKNKEKAKYFILPTWMTKYKDNLTLCQIIAGFFEQNIILNYEYNYFTNRIYQSSNNNKIEEFYDEINNILEQISNESYYFNNIFSKDIINQQINKVKEMNELSIIIYDELKNYIEDINNEKERIIKLLKKLTFVNFNDIQNNRVVFYESYKKFILDYFQNIIANELKEEENKTKKTKNRKHKNKKRKNKINKESIEKEEVKKEGENEEEKEKEKNFQKEINEEKDKKSEDEKNEDEINEEKEKDNNIIDEEKHKKYKEFFLFQNKKKEKKIRNKKNKINKINELNSKFSNNINGNENSSEDKLIRIMSKNSLSTYKSSNYQEDQLSKNEEDSSSLISDISPNNNQNINDISISSNIINNENNKNDNEINNNTNNNHNEININKINFNKITIDNNPKINYDNEINSINFKNNKIYKNYNNNYNNMIYFNNYFINGKEIIFNNYYFNYIDKGIFKYCSIIDNYLKILTPIKEKYFTIIKNMIQKHFKDKYILDFGVYGSFATDLSIEGSDIDCCIIYKKLLENELIFIEELLDFLENEKNKHEFTYEIKKYLKCRHPRIIVTIDINEKTKNINNFGKYLNDDDIKTFKIDFTFNENIQYLKDNMENVKYIKRQLIKSPQIKPVVKILKRFLKINQMNELFFGGIGSFELFLLVLNSFKDIQQKFPNMEIRVSQLLINTFEKFSFFEFDKFGIDFNNDDYNLNFPNKEEIPFIIDPLTRKNTAQFGRCRGQDIRDVFSIGYNKMFFEKTNLVTSFNCGIFPFYLNPIASINNLFSK